MKNRQELEDMAMRIHWAVQHDHLGEAVRMLDGMQTEQINRPAERLADLGETPTYNPVNDGVNL